MTLPSTVNRPHRRDQHRSSTDVVGNATAAPGPRGLPVVGSLLSFALDPLKFVAQQARTHGDVAKIDIAGLPFYQVSHPDAIKQVLVTKARDFDKGPLGRERRMLFGDGLATSDGELWRRQRRLSQPAFRNQRIATYGDAIAAEAARMTDRWRPGQSRDLHAEFMQLTLRIVCRTLFGVDVSRDVREVGAALEDVMPFFARQGNFFGHLLPKNLPTPGRVRFRRAVERLDRILYGIIARRRVKPGGNDLLSILLAARDEDGSQMSDRQLRDEAMTLFLAGHETTALALSWTVAVLSQNPHADERVFDEARALPGVLTAADLPALRWTSQCITETMRLYPPAWIIARRAKKDVEIGGFRIPARAFVAMSQWVVHRDPRFFPNPERFDPTRWEEGKDVSPHAFFPFGGGGRICIGRSFAMLEATLILATVSRRFRFRPTSNSIPTPQAGISLRPKRGLRGTVEARR